MFEYSTLKYNSVSEELVDILIKKTQNNNAPFFRILVSYYLGKLASNMRAKVVTKDRGEIPINIYAISLSPSGESKTFSTNIMEEITSGYKSIFKEQTLPYIEEKNLVNLANYRSKIKGTDPEEEEQAVKTEYKNLGPMPMDFDSGTTAALKQLRHKMLMSKIGAMSFISDEIGNNLLGNSDLLGTYLEVYDQGLLKQKITKNTKDNLRNEEIFGKVPANMMLYGTPAKLLDGSKTEDEYFSFLLTGYARRCFFGYTRCSKKDNSKTAEEIYDLLTDTSFTKSIGVLSGKFAQLAAKDNYNRKIIVPRDVSILLIKYRMHCEKLSSVLPEHEEMRKAELNHRYFKALKLAGAYAFIGGNVQMSEDNLLSAIKMAEESGIAFNNMLNRDRNYVKLAKYIATVGKEVTHVDLTEDLPFYKGTHSAKTDLMQLAIAWGYTNQIVIQSRESNNIEFFKGKTLEKTDLNKLILSYSKDIAHNYKNVLSPWDKLYVLSQKPNLNWINHHTESGHRADSDLTDGFNLIVIDVDEGTTIDNIQTLLSEYTYLIYTTKRHTKAQNRCRLVLPTNYVLNLSKEDFRGFMENVYDWLPFEVDSAPKDRCRKWATNPGNYYYNKGQLVDVLSFIPKTDKCKKYKQVIQSQQSLSNLERWFVNNIKEGNRNNHLLKYALLLVDMGKDIGTIQEKILSLNDRFVNKLSKQEIENTIFITTAKAIQAKEDN